jgi:hypothetical protein
MQFARAVRCINRIVDVSTLYRGHPGGFAELVSKPVAMRTLERAIPLMLPKFETFDIGSGPGSPGRENLPKSTPPTRRRRASDAD